MKGAAGVLAEEARIRAAYARRPSSERYSPLLPGQLFMLQEIERAVLGALARDSSAPLERLAMLDVGCGNGYWLREMVGWGARPALLAGVDLLSSRLARAREGCPPGVRLLAGSATQLPLRSAQYDVVTQFTVFSSVLDAEVRRSIAQEMLRVLKPDGMVLWYDFRVNNPWNPDVRGVTAREIRRLFSGCRITLTSLTLAPPIVRSVAPRAWLACSLLSTLAPLRTHWFGVIQPPRVPS